MPISPFDIPWLESVYISYDFFDGLLEARNILYRSNAAMNKPSKSGIYDLEIRVILGMIC